MPLFTRGSVTIDARQLSGDSDEYLRICDWLATNGYPWLQGDATQPETLVPPQGGDNKSPGIYINPADGMLHIRDGHRHWEADHGDWIVRAPDGKFSVMKTPALHALYTQQT